MIINFLLNKSNFKMLFIQFMNEKNMFFGEHLGVVMSVCTLAILGGYVLQSDDVVWAVFMVQVLIIIYCIIWSIIMWKTMTTVMSEEEEEEVDLPDLITEEDFDFAALKAHTIACTIAAEFEADLADDYHVNVYNLQSLMSDEETWDRWDVEKVIHLKKKILAYECRHRR